MECNGVARLRHILTDDPHPSHVTVLFELPRIVPSPCAGVKEGRGKRQPKRDSLHFKTTGEASSGIWRGFILDNSSHYGAAIHMNRLFEHAKDRASGMTHVVLADFARGVRQPMG